MATAYFLRPKSRQKVFGHYVNRPLPSENLTDYIMRNTLLVLVYLFPCLIVAQAIDSVALRQVDSLLVVVQRQTAEKQYDQALIINAAAEQLALATFGRASLPYANCCLQHAMVLQSQWSKAPLEEAVKWASEALSIRQNILGKNSVECAPCLGKLAAFYSRLRQYPQAAACGLEAKTIIEEAGITDGPDYPIVLNNLAGVYCNMGDYAKGEATYLISKQWMEQKKQRESRGYVQMLSQLANLHLWNSHHEKALEYASEATDIYKKIGGETDTYYAFPLRCMAQANMGLQRYEEAEKQLQKALEVVEKTVGKNDFRYADILSMCATLYNSMKAYDKAIPILTESLQLAEKSAGKNNSYCTLLGDLATAYIETGQLTLAEPLLLEAAAIIDNNIDEGNIPLIVWNKLGALHRMKGQFEQAEDLCRKIQVFAQPARLSKINYMSEDELQNMRRATHLDDNAFSLAYFAALCKAQPAEIAGVCYNNALFNKGFLQQAATRMRQLASKHPDSRADLDSLHALQSQLATMYATPKGQRDLARMVQMEENVGSMQKKIARSISGYEEATRQVYWPDVQQKLQPNEAVIEFVRFAYYNRSIQFPTDSVLYAAMILLPGTDTPQFVPLFEERDIAPLFINKSVQKSEYINALYANHAPTTEGQKNLYQTIWQPLETTLAAVKTVYFSPDGLLHRINFNAIKDNNGQPLATRYNLVQLGSTRQLTIPSYSVTSSSSASAQLYGGIQYDAVPLVATAPPAISTDMATRRGLDFAQNDTTLRADTWNYLRWTEVEVNAAAETMQRSGMTATVLKGAEATEESFKEIGVNGPSPRILHIATHGFFFPDPNTTATQSTTTTEREYKVSEHPMIRSGLVLAGGNHTWKTGKPFRPELEDGILTAYEISQMNLANTELVVLSACETGLGDIVGNEGVYGLQRAFKIAGAQYLIMSLWQVPDFQTQVFMTAFYRHWLEGNQSVPDAFRIAQAELRAKYGDAFLWAGFLLVE
jgi:CHAT domain-containing protein